MCSVYHGVSFEVILNMGYRDDSYWGRGSSQPGIDSVGIQLKAHGHIKTDTDRAHCAHCFIDTILVSLETWAEYTEIY